MLFDDTLLADPEEEARRKARQMMMGLGLGDQVSGFDQANPSSADQARQMMQRLGVGDQIPGFNQSQSSQLFGPPKPDEIPEVAISANPVTDWHPLMGAGAMPSITDQAPLSNGSMWREDDNGVRINDGFDAAGNLFGTSSPNRVAVAGPGAGYTRHNPDGTVSPIAFPTDNTAGMLQNMRANDSAITDGPALMRHQMAMQLKGLDVAGELEKARILSGNKHEGQFNKTLSLTGDPRIPTAQAVEGINQMERSGEITPEAAQNMKLQRLTSRIGPDGKSFVPLYDSKTGSMTELAGALSSGELANYPPEVVKKYLEENMGITRDKVVKRYADLLQEGKPWYAKGLMGHLSGIDDPNLFDKKTLPREKQTEFDAITRIFGRK